MNKLNDPEPSLSGYLVRSPVYEEVDSRYYKAIGIEDNARVILKMSRPGRGSASLKELFQRDFTISSTFGTSGMVLNPLHYFFSSLTMISMYHKASEPDRRLFDSQLSGNVDILKAWAESCPENYRAKYLLVTTALHELTDQQNAAAKDCYTEAIRLSHENENLFEEALSNELFARFKFNSGNPKSAAKYMSQALQLYRNWGASVKHSIWKYVTTR